MAVNLNRIVHSNGFKIYFWPILVYWLISLLLMFIFVPFEPDSSRENLFVSINGLMLLCLLWLLVARYRKITGNSVGKRAIILLIIVSALLVIGISCAGIRIYLLY